MPQAPEKQSEPPRLSDGFRATICSHRCGRAHAFASPAASCSLRGSSMTKGITRGGSARPSMVAAMLKARQGERPVKAFTLWSRASGTSTRYLPERPPGNCRLPLHPAFAEVSLTHDHAALVLAMTFGGGILMPLG